MDGRARRGDGGTGAATRLLLVLVAVTVAGLVATGRGGAAPGPAANLDQCRNGAAAAPVPCTGSSWQNGNLGAENAHFREGDSVPFRTVVTGLDTSAGHTLTIEYDTLASGKHAYDYLTSHDRTETTSDPCSGISPCAPGAGKPLPPDPSLAFANPSSAQAAGSIAIWNGAVSSVSYGGSDPAGTRSVTIAFTASASTVVLAWGGHVASQVDWGAGNAAGAISGSPYHMRLISLDGKAGNQDRSMKSSAILPVPATFTTSASASAVEVGDAVVDVATLSGPNGAVTGSVAFFVCGPSLLGPPSCDTGGAPVGAEIVTAGSATSPAFAPALAGSYCFRAEYAPDVFALYSPGTHTNLTSECFAATVATGKLEVRKALAPATDAGRFDLLIDGSAHADAVADGGTTGERTVAAGAHSVAETAAGGAALSDYDTSIECRAADGAGPVVTQGSGTSLAVVIAKGDDVVCTITNVRKPPPPPEKVTLTVVKHVVNDDGGSKGAADFTLEVSGPSPSPSSFPGSETGTTVQLEAGPYAVTEVPADGYAATYSAGCAGTAEPGATPTCTITNDDEPPPPPAKAVLTVVKRVVNDDGGTKAAEDFTLLVEGVNAAPAAFPGSETGTQVELDAGAYGVTEALADGYAVSYSDGCSGTIAAGARATCVVTNDDVAPPPAPATLRVIKHVVNDDGGSKSAADFTILVSGSAASPASFAGSESGTDVSLDPGAYGVSEAPADGYAVSYSDGCSGTIAPGGSATCVVTNDDVEAPAPPPPPPPSPTPPAPPQTVDVSITKTDTPDPAFVGGRLRYTLVVTNVGASRATDVVVTDELPSELQLLSVTTTQGTCSAGQVVACALGALEPGAAATVEIVVRPLTPGAVLNTATVRTAEPDEAPANNVASAPSLIEGPFAPPRQRCAQLLVDRRTLTVGTRAVVVARVKLDRLGVRGMRVTIRGAGIRTSARTGAGGVARIVVRPTRTGIATVHVAGQPARCGVRRIGVVGIFRPPSLTG